MSENNYRKYKLLELRKKKLAFTNTFKKNYSSHELHIQYDNKTHKELNKLNLKISLAGRIITKRILGKVSFITLQDYGGRIQLYIASNEFEEGFYDNFFKKYYDLGDIIGISGVLFKTKTGELTINCKEIHLLTKAIRSLPDKYHGVINKEIRYRKRYLDLIYNEKSINTFKMRYKIITYIRKFMINNNFIEVETPMMHYFPGGATARPFTTYYNALDYKMYLRIAPELYLKKLIIGGFEKIFELNRSFRNEKLSPSHNPEFTMIELYMAYANYHDLIEFIEEFLNYLTYKVIGSLTIKYNDYIINFRKPFTKMTMKEAICFFSPNIGKDDLNDINKIYLIANSLNITINNSWGLGKIQTEIFKKTVENNLIQPTFITNYPIEVSPLARSNDENPFFADRFELFIAGEEIGNGFSELNDAEDQKERFIKQNKNFIDDEYITALEYGLPPTAGVGIGIDRLVMILTNNTNIRDVILFPSLRKKNNYK